MSAAYAYEAALSGKPCHWFRREFSDQQWFSPESRDVQEAFSRGYRDYVAAEVAKRPRAVLPPIDMGLVRSLIAQRASARVAKDWAAADRLRGELITLGIEIEDTAEGPRWRRVSSRV